METEWLVFHKPDGRRCCRTQNPKHLCRRCSELYAAHLREAARARAVAQEVDQAKALLAILHAGETVAPGSAPVFRHLHPESLFEAVPDEPTAADLFRFAVMQWTGQFAAAQQRVRTRPRADALPPDPWEAGLQRLAAAARR